MKVAMERLKTGLFTENVIFVQVLAMCPTLAVTSSAKNGFGMGIASMVVLIGANVVISLIRKLVPDKIRIPAFIVVIATFVTLLGFLLEGFVPALNDSLGIFIPLIVVNCMILGRAESYASKNGPLASFFDGLGMGLGFTLALTIIGVIREILGSGMAFGFKVTPAAFQPALIFVLAPGAFITLGILMALFNLYNMKKSKEGGK
ncbi:electron transport complex subunit E [Clostridium sediminicola]|uniref:electron transport complex subunit RsxE n=1 Tax=Clostridium sediminicola TaxID=3114879 RepID=UPI0031F2295C